MPIEKRQVTDSSNKPKDAAERIGFHLVYSVLDSNSIGFSPLS
ncbi:MAG: hypothetical protein ACI9LM_005416 [Alteromonadaceae bacterium]|jgi:hypothetical protein